MAEPVSIFITATVLPMLLATIQGSLQLALDAMPEIHDKRNRRAMEKLYALFYKAKGGEFTEKGEEALFVPEDRVSELEAYTRIDFEQAKHYYSRLQTYALFNENQTLLAHLEKIIQLMEGTLVVKNLMEKNNNNNNAIDSSDIDHLNAKIKNWDMGSMMVETFRRHDLPSYEAVTDTPALIRDPPASEKKSSSSMRALEKPAMWCLVAVMPPLLFVPKIRQKC